jgi:hypothetical protein
MSTSMVALAEGGSDRLKERAAASRHVSVETPSKSEATAALASAQATTKNASA